MHGPSLGRGFSVILAGYAAGAAWFWLDADLPRVTPLPSRVLIAFLLPTAAAVLLWLFHAIELHRPVCVREPGDCAATERIIFRIHRVHWRVAWPRGFAADRSTVDSDVGSAPGLCSYRCSAGERRQPAPDDETERVGGHSNASFAPFQALLDGDQPGRWIRQCGARDS